MDYKTRVDQAAREYIARRDRRKHPLGHFDGGGRWYPSEDETRSCCATIRAPSRRWPYSLMLHCRTIRHVAALYGVEASDVRRAAKRLDPIIRQEREAERAATIARLGYDVYDPARY